MYKIKDIAKILNVSDRTVERKFPRFLEKVFSAAQKPFLKMRIAKRFFTAFRSNIYNFRLPLDSPLRTLKNSFSMLVPSHLPPR